MKKHILLISIFLVFGLFVAGCVGVPMTEKPIAIPTGPTPEPPTSIPVFTATLTPAVLPTTKPLSASVPLPSQIAVPTPQPTQSAIPEPVDLKGHLAYYSPRFGGVVIRNLESGKKPEERITDDWSSDPAWSPDGKKLAFVKGSNPDEGYNLYIMDVTSKKVVTVTSGNHVWDSPSWSPDGERIVFRALSLVSKDPSSEGRGYGPSQIMFVNADGSGLDFLIDPYPSFKNLPFSEIDTENPCWSTDGEYILFAAQVGVVSKGEDGKFYGLDREHIFKVSLDLTEIRDLTPMDLGSSGGPSPYYWFPACSPKGKKFAFVANFFEEDPFNLYVDSLTGADKVQVTREMMVFNPAWSPDGKYLAFSSEGNIYVVKADGSMKEPLLIDEGDSPSWGP